MQLDTTSNIPLLHCTFIWNVASDTNVSPTMGDISSDATPFEANAETPLQSGHDDSSSDSGSSSEEEKTEWLATTRERRSNAGNRMSTLVEKEQDEDDELLELLFAEDADDAGFEEADEAQSDVDMDDSDDDEDQGPAAPGAEELEGERQLQQEQKAARQAKKRKGDDHLPKAFRKRVKIDRTAVKVQSPARPKKKSERASWIPTVDDAPTRASARSSTKMGKEQLYAQMVDREKKRLRQLQIMENAAKKKSTETVKVLTQADRMAEAAKVEKRNAKSLNTWETAEKQREEEEKAKLAALNNRHMDGPVVTWWSGMAEWVGGSLKRVGKSLVVEEVKPRAYKKRQTLDATSEVASNAGSTISLVPSTTVATATPAPAPVTAVGVAPLPNGLSEKASTPSTPNQTAPLLETAVSQLPGPSTEALIPSPSATHVENDPAAPQTPVPDLSQPTPPPPPLATPQPASSSSLPGPATLNGSAPLPGFLDGINYYASLPDEQPPRLMPSQTQPFTFVPPTAAEQPTQAPPPSAATHGIRNLLILENFDEHAMRNKDWHGVANHVLTKLKHVAKPQSMSNFSTPPSR